MKANRWKESQKKVFARRNDDESFVAQKVPIRGIFGWVRSTHVNACMDLLNRHVNAAVNIGRNVVLKKRPKELARTNFVRRPLIIEVHKQRLKPIAGVGLKYAGKHLRVVVNLPTVATLFRSVEQYQR
jgi:hypothetical protein